MIRIRKSATKSIYRLDTLKKLKSPHTATSTNGILTVEADSNETVLLGEYLEIMNTDPYQSRMDSVIIENATVDLRDIREEYRYAVESYTFKNCTVNVGTPIILLSDMNFNNCKVVADFSKYDRVGLRGIIFTNCELDNIDIGGMNNLTIRFNDMTVPKLKSTPLTNPVSKSAHTDHSTMFTNCTIGNSDTPINLYTNVAFADSNTLIGDLTPVCGVSGVVPKGVGVLNLGLSAYIPSKVAGGSTRLQFSDETCKIGFAPLQPLLNTLDSLFRAKLPETLLTPYINTDNDNTEFNINIENSMGTGFILNVNRFYGGKNGVVRKVNMTVTGNSDTLDFCLAKDETIGYEETPPAVNVISRKSMLNVDTGGDALYQFNNIRFRHKSDVDNKAIDAFNSDIIQTTPDGKTSEYLLFKHKISNLVNQCTHKPQIVQNIMTTAKDMLDKTEIPIAEIDESKMGGFYKTLQMLLRLFGRMS